MQGQDGIADRDKLQGDDVADAPPPAVEALTSLTLNFIVRHLKQWMGIADEKEGASLESVVIATDAELKEEQRDEPSTSTSKSADQAARKVKSHRATKYKVMWVGGQRWHVTPDGRWYLAPLALADPEEVKNEETQREDVLKNSAGTKNEGGSEQDESKPRARAWNDPEDDEDNEDCDDDAAQAPKALYDFSCLPGDIRERLWSMLLQAKVMNKATLECFLSESMESFVFKQFAMFVKKPTKEDEDAEEKKKHEQENRLRVFSIEELMETVARKCTNLQILDLEGCEYLTDAMLRAILVKQDSCYSVSLKGCSHVTDKSLVLIADFGALRHLDLTDCFSVTDVPLVQVISHCPNLRSLRVGNCQDLSDNFLKLVSRKAQFLQDLDISGLRPSILFGTSLQGKDMPWAGLCRLSLVRSHLSPGLLAQLIRLTALQELDLSGCVGVTPEEIASILLPKVAVHTAHLNDVTDVSPEFWPHIRQLTSLRVLNMNRCTFVDKVKDKVVKKKGDAKSKKIARKEDRFELAKRRKNKKEKYLEQKMKRQQESPEQKPSLERDLEKRKAIKELRKANQSKGSGTDDEEAECSVVHLSLQNFEHPGEMRGMLAAIKKMPQLTHLDLSMTIDYGSYSVSNSLEEILKQFPQLQSLQLRGWQNSIIGGFASGATPPRYPLRSLVLGPHLGGYWWGVQPATGLRDLLSLVSNTLVELDITQLVAGDLAMLFPSSPSGAPAVHSPLALMRKLRILRLHSNEQTPWSKEWLDSFFRFYSNSKLKSLDLSRKSMSVAGETGYARFNHAPTASFGYGLGVRAPPTLRKLVLYSWCLMATRGVRFSNEEVVSDVVLGLKHSNRDKNVQVVFGDDPRRPSWG